MPRVDGQRVRDLYDALGSIQQVAAELGIPEGTARWHIKRSPEAQEEDDSDLIRKQRDKVKQDAERKEHVEAVKELAFRDFLTELCKDTVERLPPPPKFKTAQASTSISAETLVTLWSDWHYAEIVKGESVQGLNEYNRDIALSRVHSLVAKILGIREKMTRGGWKFRRIVIAVNGDMISGSVHETEKHSNPNNVILATYECGRLLAMAIRDIASAFQEVLVVCISGNHGRLPDHKRPMSKEPSRNWDTMIALIARTALEDVANVRFEIPDSYSAVFDVEGHLFGMSHGHDVRGWMQTPIYGFNRMVSSLNSIRVSRGKPINYFLFGHFHNKVSVDYAGSEYFVNGSLIGGTEYSVNSLGRADQPCQWLLGVHKDHGVTHRWPIYPDDDCGSYSLGRPI